MIDVIDLPCTGIYTDSFDPVRPSSVNRMQGRVTERAFFGTPFWQASYVAPFSRLDTAGEVDAFLMRIQNGAVFRAYDMSRQRPAEYARAPLSGTRATGGSFDGTATISAIADAQNLTIAGLPSGFRLRAGDHVSFHQSSLVVSLHRIIADVTASETGAAAIQILHPLDLQNFTSSAAVHLERPFFLAQIDGFSVQRRKGSRAATFSAIEVFFYEVEE